MSLDSPQRRLLPGVEADHLACVSARLGCINNDITIIVGLVFTILFIISIDFLTFPLCLEVLSIVD